MNTNKVLIFAVVVLVALSGCLSSGGDTDVGEGVEVDNNSVNATEVTYSIRIDVDDTTAGDELTAVGVTYPRDNFVVSPAQHDNVSVGVDTNGDGEPDETFNETHISGVNNNDYSFDVTLDTGYTLESGDTVSVRYPSVDNPTEAGNYTVEVRLNDRQTENATVVIE